MEQNKQIENAIGELLREIGRVSPRAGTVIEADLKNPEMSAAKCAETLRAHAKKHQQGGFWGCACFGVNPENEVVKFVLDFYKIPAEWLAKEKPAAQTAAGRVNLMELI